MTLTEAQLADFALYARRPETWLAGSRRHLVVFEILSDRLDGQMMQSGVPQDEVSGCFYGAYLHAGLAVENAVKAWLVASEPTMIEGGKVRRAKLGGRSGHAFVHLCEQILGALTDVERRVLLKLEEFVVWAGKYTVPMDAAILYNQDSMQIMRSAPLNERELIVSLVKRIQGHARAP